MTWSIIIPIIVFGLALVFLEIFVLPGMISGIIGGLLVIYGVYQSFLVYGAVVGGITLLLTILIFVLGMVLFFKSGTWKKVALNTSIDSKVNTINPDLKAGDTGKTISRLAPMGKAYINNEYFEVSTNGEYVEENSQIIVLKIEGNRILVKKVE
jgi:membrane-bound ClpP family serine protease